jgi:arylsulfatase A-like enzyme
MNSLGKSIYWSRLLAFLLTPLALTLFVPSWPAQGTSGKPNIIIILADDLGYGDVGFNGCADIPTPNIDSLASNGVLCTDGYVTHPFCSPSRAALLTGRYQQRFGHEHQPDIANNAGDPLLGVPTSELFLPQILKPAGYVSGLIGKWHLGGAPSVQPTARGFDEFFGFLPAQSTYYNATVLRNTTPVVETSYLTDAFTREGVSFINRHATQPFFLLMAYNAPHAPYQQPPQVYRDRVASITNPTRQVYAAMVCAIDDGVGQLVQTLQSQNLLNNTLIFFLSDNGPEVGGGGRSAPLRGFKFNVLEGGIRVPFAIQWTGQSPAGLVYTQPISALDIVATATAAAGVPLPSDRPYDGLNVVPFLTGSQASPQRTLFWRVFGLGSTGPPGSQGTIWAVRSGPLKLVTEKATVGQPPALYNLPNDLSESSNLASSQPTDVNALNTLYGQWSTQLISPL